MPGVLIISQRDDVTADRIIVELQQHGLDALRLDMADFPQAAHITARLDGPAWSGPVRVGERELMLQEITGVYYRRPSAPHVGAGGSPDAQAFLEQEILLGHGGVLAALPEYLWLGHPRRLEAVKRSKPWQLTLAAWAGLTVPQTMVTGSTTDAAAFADELGGQVAVKPFGVATFLGPEGEQQAVYARRLTPGQIREHDLCGIPHQVQQWIPAAHAVRMTVVDGEIFAARIHLGSAAARIDWRSDYAALSYERIWVPRPVASGVRRLVRALGLRYAALDFLVDRAGQWWFLELNANGQWAWIECVAEDIAAAIARGLATAPALAGV